MTVIAITQRVDYVSGRGERRDSLDQRWTTLLSVAGFCPCAMPNDAQSAVALFGLVRPRGLLLTGGNSLVEYGGDAPGRDACEYRLLALANRAGVPVLGVCRGMQLLLIDSGASLVAVANHVRHRQLVVFDEGTRVVNSYHDWGCYDVPEQWHILGRSRDGVVKAIRHRTRPAIGIMWHPERIDPFAPDDIGLLQRHFGMPS